MSLAVIAFALTAALLHAVWNGFLRSGSDRLWTITVMSFAGTAASLIALPFLPLPSAQAWPFIVLSGCLQVAYSLFLVAAYRHGQLGQVYPIVRGTAPLLVTLGSFLLTGYLPTPLQLVGVVLIALGIISLAFGRGRARASSLLFALATGLMVSSYGIVDSLGVRSAGNALAYSAWVNIVFGLLLPLAYVRVRGRLNIVWRARETALALGGGFVSLVSYTLVVVAFSLGSAGPVSALRETSVIFAVLIGWIFLGEKLTLTRILAAVIVVIGAICLGLGG
jgi:drug/metabolite transporter (DMT)-like permease